MQERLLGRFLLVASTGLFAYYIVWLLITVNSPVDSLLLPKQECTALCRRRTLSTVFVP